MLTHLEKIEPRKDLVGVRIPFLSQSIIQIPVFLHLQQIFLLLMMGCVEFASSWI